ncbi:hypothetical protein ANN_25747 [Periplaneta americana]|uniref:Uncharacterized protein n=1 Tax=Periplaneta americana TaxID=6978 RepID=A0ABQ8S409_PERAM|nr:hypothetical protein ANN_25747 [Periplaneta americana]
MAGLCEGGNEPPGSLKAMLGLEIVQGRLGNSYPCWIDYCLGREVMWVADPKACKERAAHPSERRSLRRGGSDVQSNHQLRMDVYAFPDLADMVMCYGEARGKRKKSSPHVPTTVSKQKSPSPHNICWTLSAPSRRWVSPSPRIGGRQRRHPFSIDDYTELKGKGIEH